MHNRPSQHFTAQYLDLKKRKINYNLKFRNMSSLFTKAALALRIFTPQRKRPNSKYALSDSERTLKGKTILLTGGTDGIGRCTAQMLCDMGAEVILLSRNAQKGVQVVEQINKKGRGKASLIECDLASMTSIRACAEEILAARKKINILVNCAGVNMGGVVKYNPDCIESTWATNYFAPVLLTRLLLPIITERVVNITADTRAINALDYDHLTSYTDFATESPYLESKLALNMFSTDLAEELSRSGVTVNTLMPGYIKTNLLRNAKGFSKIEQHMMNRMASPTTVGAERVVRMVAANRYGTKSGLYMVKDKIRPFHPEARKVEKRKLLRELSTNFLSSYL